jgi:hypothetical protein
MLEEMGFENIIAPQDRKRLVVIADLHGDYLALEEILDLSGAISHGIKDQSVWVSQIGDLTDVTDQSFKNDLKVLELSKNYIDAQICGNHDATLLSKTAAEFTGLTTKHFGELCSQAAKIAWHPCAVIGQSLMISHAGISPFWVKKFYPDKEPETVTAIEIAEKLIPLWASFRQDNQQEIFSAVGPSRGGQAECGGLLWIDWKDLIADLHEFPNMQLQQIIGHNPLPNFSLPTQSLSVTCIDGSTDSDVKALIKDPGQSWDVISVKRRFTK